MVITDKFVYIHKPKTGGSFVTDALLKLYEGKWNLWIHAKLGLLKKVHFTNRFGKLILTANKHGGCLDIPGDHLQKTILSTIRNPFDYYVSQYEFGWWKRKEWHRFYLNNVEKFNTRFASFPNLSFCQFMELMPAAFNDLPHQVLNDTAALGRCSVEFIHSHFYDPQAVLQKISKDYIVSGAYKQDMFPTHFLFTHLLNKQLHQFLLKQGYPEESLEFILSKKKVLPQGKGRTGEQKWEKYYTPELKVLVRKKDWVLFELFPDFDKE